MTANTYKVTYKDGIFELKNANKSSGGALNPFGEEYPTHHIGHVIQNALVNETSIEGYLKDVKEKADILNKAIETYKKAEQVARENKTTQNDENNKSFYDRLNEIKEKINIKKIEGGKRKTFRKKNKKSKKNNSKNKHNNRL